MTIIWGSPLNHLVTCCHDVGRVAYIQICCSFEDFFKTPAASQGDVTGRSRGPERVANLESKSNEKAFA